MTETAHLARLLASRLQALWGAAVEITGIERRPGGASRESWGVQARTADGAEHRLILLRDPGRSDPHRDVAVEAAAMVATRAAGVPVPELYDHGELAHRGDPMHDLGWLCTKAWRFGGANPVGGFGAREPPVVD